jgi:spore maturation protein SpmA
MRCCAALSGVQTDVASPALQAATVGRPQYIALGLNRTHQLMVWSVLMTSGEDTFLIPDFSFLLHEVIRVLFPTTRATCLAHHHAHNSVRK